MAAEPAQDPSKEEVKRRAMRRLVAALVLLVIAVGGLAVLDHLAQQRRGNETPPPPPPLVSTELPARLTPPPPPDEQPAVEPEPPPPPEIDNSPIPGPLPLGSTPSDPETAAGGARDTGAARPRTGPPGPAPTASAALLPDARAPLAPAAPVDRWSPATAGSTAPSPPSAYLVQVGVFASPANAEALRDRLRKAGIDAHTETRVRVGPFATEAEARAVAARLRALGLEPVTLPQR